MAEKIVKQLQFQNADGTLTDKYTINAVKLNGKTEEELLAQKSQVQIITWEADD